MKRVIIHWTAGANKANSTDRQHYHYIIQGDGSEIAGIFPVVANEVCRTDAAKRALYAAHTGGGNTGSIGVSMAGMAGFKSRNNVGKYPLTKIQCERMFELVAVLCKRYGIVVNPNNVMTHYEFGLSHPKSASAGKIDIIYLPPYPDIPANKIGDFIRGKVKWYLQKV